MQVIVDGLLTHYEASGEGQLVVLLHGWGDQGSGLKSLQTALSKAYRVIVPDLPGFGTTQQPVTAWDLTDYATFVAHFLAKIGVKHVYAFIGHSNGGGILIRGLGRGIMQADKAVLLASAGIRSSYRGGTKLLRLVTKAGKVVTTPLPKRVKGALRT